MSRARFLVFSLIFSAALYAGSSFGITLPAGFADSLVTSVSGPTALAFTPDGRLLITTQGGVLRVFQAGALLPTAALTLGSRVCTNSERGLLGVAVDPAFATNRYIYLFYTFNKNGVCSTGDAFVPVERISRYTLPDTNVIDPASELVLIDNVLNFGGNHNGGDVHFGSDGYLYASIGDGGCDYAGDSGCGGSNDASRDTNILNGKILRIAPDGSIPPSNPFLGAGTARCNTGPASSGMKCQETFAWGFRNPFRFTFRPGTSQLTINDVGQDAWEEIDLGLAGADYGWNCREGAHTNSTTGKCSPTPAGMIDPIFNYQHNITVPGTSSSGCNAITGGAFVPAGVWPPSWDGAYLFSDYICGTIFRLSGSGPFSATEFGTSLGGGSAVDMIFGPYNATQSLYYTTYAGGGEVHRIDYTGGPQPGRTFFTLPPCRAVDTRDAAGPFGGPALAAGGSRDFQLAGRCGVPSDAVAISGNVTVVTPASPGFLQIAPTGIYTEISTINFPAGKTRANNGVLSLQGSPAGWTTIGSGFPSGTCDFIVDVNGYFR